MLLKHVPPHCQTALEIGCGTGAFARLLAERAGHVLALDLSPNMVRIAAERSAHCPNIDYQVGDVMAWTFAPGQFDCIASIAALHHLPLEQVLPRLKQALKPGGALLILDLFKAEGLAGLLGSALAMPVSLTLRLLKTRRLKSPQKARQAWQAHGQHDLYLTLSKARRVYGALLPGAKVRKHLLWRYSVVWNSRAGA
ncbi:MAG: class I SAM-dependent methyltransferase [Anaerolineae bacterium]|nr:class I SAM-dependent methyltransferase [Anaerolineae bacterium]